VTIDQLLKKWLGQEGGAERANYQMFLTELTLALGLPTPEPKGQGLGEYQFEAPVKSQAVLGTKGTGRIDLYKRDCFILEAKQSQLKEGEAAPPDPAGPPPEPLKDLFGNIVGFQEPKGKAPPRYDRLMADARVQAERYALALPDEHRTPPFLIVADIGRTFELYFDWAGNGRGYGPFPDERHYRVRLEDLASADKIAPLDLTAANTLRAIWTTPAEIDPRLKAAAVTRDIAELLSKVAAQLEKEERDRNPGAVEIALGIEATSLFLMRMLFCMFAEDVELLPKDSFKRFLADAKGRSELFWRDGLTNLWSRMNSPDETNRFWSQGDAIVRYFNGNLFANTRIYDLPPEHKEYLLIAAGKDWRAVEPAIFGTLLEQVLTAADRSRLGAHYTPRAYVERLVQATIMDVLTPEWVAVRDAARAKADAGDTAAAIADACAFHRRLNDLRVLDPACGTGNFLYVAMEQLLRLEGEVRQFVVGLGGTLAPAVLPNQFLGLELNPRAAVIAELVLWIGWLRYRLANTPEAIVDPVLPPLANINGGTHGGYDAVLVRTLTGEPDTQKPRRPEWPEADYIVGNPPFIGKGSIIREALGNEYVEALWRANTEVPKSADFVMHWWDRSASILTAPGTRLKRFGLVTTNSITQVFNRRVTDRYLNPENARCANLVLAIADHPWRAATEDTAAVRIAMTVAEVGSSEGRLLRITHESGIGTDEPQIETAEVIGPISSRLRPNDDLPEPVPLLANRGLSNTGMLLAGSGFKVDHITAQELSRDDGAEKIVRPYVSGGEILGRPRGRFVIDLHGLDEKGARQSFPRAYDHLLRKVHPVRATNNDPQRKSKWWLFGRANTSLRAQIDALDHYIGTTETAKHRVFQLIPTSVVPDHMVITIGLGVFGFGVLSSTVHVEWSLEFGGTLEDRPRYNKSVCFDPFPFPVASDKIKAQVEELAAELDETRRKVLSENPRLTMTLLYNLVEEVRSGAPISPDRDREVVRARARIVAKLHKDLDQAVADAYGWGDEWRRAPLPPGEIVARLVRLNAERAAEEAQGHFRWLRPDYQVPRFAPAAAKTKPFKPPAPKPT
jgi:hypothetical protein